MAKIIPIIIIFYNGAALHLTQSYSSSRQTLVPGWHSFSSLLATFPQILFCINKVSLIDLNIDCFSGEERLAAGLSCWALALLQTGFYQPHVAQNPTVAGSSGSVCGAGVWLAFFCLVAVLLDL